MLCFKAEMQMEGKDGHALPCRAGAAGAGRVGAQGRGQVAELPPRVQGGSWGYARVRRWGLGTLG
jgi:hypothetical protein